MTKLKNDSPIPYKPGCGMWFIPDGAYNHVYDGAAAWNKYKNEMITERIGLGNKIIAMSCGDAIDGESRIYNLKDWYNNRDYEQLDELMPMLYEKIYIINNYIKESENLTVTFTAEVESLEMSVVANIRDTSHIIPIYNKVREVNLMHKGASNLGELFFEAFVNLIQWWDHLHGKSAEQLFDKDPMWIDSKIRTNNRKLYVGLS